MNSIQSKGFPTLYFLWHPNATWEAKFRKHINVFSFPSTRSRSAERERERETRSRSATNFIYWLIRVEFMPMSAHGRESQTNSVSISTASCRIRWTLCQWSFFRSKLQSRSKGNLSINNLLIQSQYRLGIWILKQQRR